MQEPKREGGDVSKQPESANSSMSRLRRPFGRLRDMPIWSKLGLIMIVPTIATIVVGTSGLIENVNTLNDATRARDLAELTAASGELVHQLQDERTAAVLVLGVDQKTPARQQYLQRYRGLHRTVDEAKNPYQRERSSLLNLPSSLDRLLTRLDGNLQDLPAIRSQVTNATLPLTAAAQSYDGLINDLLDIRDSSAQLAGDPGLSDRMRAAAALARSKEFQSIRRVVVHRALAEQELPRSLHNDYIKTTTGEEQALQSFRAVATPQEAAHYDQTVANSPDQREAQNYGGYIESLDTTSLAEAPFDAADWDEAMVGNAGLIRTAEKQLDDEVVDRATTLRNAVQRRVFIDTGVLLAILLLAILFAWLVARSMARSLRELRHGALSVAQYGLPQAVARLRDPQLATQTSPQQVASQIAEPLPVRSRDEFGQVTEAFNAVHLEAVRTAAEQAALRASVATMFVNLARRSQILVDRLIGHLDRLERGEEDPDRLAELFQIDHLATRMRRNDENLLVLAGADSTRVQREPAPLLDVLRAAQSEVEHYTRIEFGSIDGDIEIGAHAVNDLVHLVAELFDNATSFSPPDSQVLVEARRIGDRAALYVEDRGIGISGEQLHELNERLATPPMVDVAVSRMMGLVVVARLAARHGIQVQLRPAAERGTVAEVTLPSSVLVATALGGRIAQPAAVTAGAGWALPSPGPQPRMPFAAPLALESRPASAPGPGNGSATGPGGRPSEPTPVNGGVDPGQRSRPMPAGFDLTGSTQAVNGAGFPPRPPGQRASEPLPQRKADDRNAGGGDNAGRLIPRQLPSGPEATRPVNRLAGSTPPAPAGPTAGGFGGPPPGPPTPSDRPGPSGPMAPPAGPAASGPAAPPVWPPVAASSAETAPPGDGRDAASDGDWESVPPPLPEQLAAALDMTAELPRVVPRTPQTPSAAPESRPRFADETMELPIFRELESAWFRTRRSTPEVYRPAGPQPAYPAADPADREAPSPVVSTGSPSPRTQDDSTVVTGSSAMANEPTSGGWSTEPVVTEWSTAADEGWRAASAAAEMEPSVTTEAGLPKRVPMAQLVPGGVDKPTVPVQRRTPESVRGLLSAYHRGVQRGRSNAKDDTATSPGPPAGRSQAGSARRADSGQEEQD
jgi:signal transduction histidine kinase